jgi:hypothetical protein
MRMGRCVLFFVIGVSLVDLACIDIMWSCGCVMYFIDG